MYTNYQERVDAYLRGEMDNETRIRFERELKSDESLAKVYRETKAISDAIADRREKLDMMAHWNKEEINQRLIHRKNIIRGWTIGLSAAACIAVGFFAISSLFMTTSSPTSDFIMPNFSNEVYHRGPNNPLANIDIIIDAKNYQYALALVDSRLVDYTDELKQYEEKDTLTEKEEYELEACKEVLGELNWRRANLLMALGRFEEAQECLKQIVNSGSSYQERADSLLQTMTYE